MKMTLKLLLGTGLLLAAAPAAHAQDYQIQPVFDMSVITINAGIQAAEMSARKQAGLPDKYGHTAVSATRPASLAYAPSAALKARTVQGYVTRLQAKNPTTAQAVATSFGPGKYSYGTIYQGLVKGKGLRENDAVDAMTAYMVLGWMIANNVQDGNAITPAMVRGVRGQLGPRLSQSAKLTASGVAAQLGEEVKLQFVIVQGGWQSAIKENALPAYQQGIAGMFKNQYGMDFRQLKLTSGGFAKK